MHRKVQERLPKKGNQSIKEGDCFSGLLNGGVLLLTGFFMIRQRDQVSIIQITDQKIKRKRLDRAILSAEEG